MKAIEKREMEASEKWKESYSLSGIRLLESAVKHAKILGRSSLQLKDIALVLPQEETIRNILRKVNLDPKQIQTSLELSLNNRRIEEDSWPAPGLTHNASIENVISIAKKESEDRGSSKIRASDIMVAIWESQTTSGKALREALSAGQEKGVSFITQLRSVINQVEKP